MATLFLVMASGCSAGDVVAKVPRSDGSPSTTRPDAGGAQDFGISLPDGSGSDATRPDPGCTSAPNADGDGDGYTVAQGDCNDCDKSVNPGAYDVAGNAVDEDCSGAVDDEVLACDEGLPLDGDAVQAAKALGICRMALPDAQGKERTWGLLKAAYVFPNGTTASLPLNEELYASSCSGLNGGGPPNSESHGILPGFGAVVKPRQGTNLVALSSGIARSGVNEGSGGISPEEASMCTNSTMPMGFPVSSYSTCGDLSSPPGPSSVAGMANDPIALELVIRVPTNAQALSFDFNFYTYEYSVYLCSEFNDAFVALLFSKAPTVPSNHNIAFDSQQNPVSVNNGFVEVCSPFTYQGRKNGMDFNRDFPCAFGTADLKGTGFEGHAATGWLQTVSNVVPGEDITLRFAIWDAGDQVLDSTVLIDNLKWDAKPGNTVTRRPTVE